MGHYVDLVEQTLSESSKIQERKEKAKKEVVDEFKKFGVHPYYSTILCNKEMEYNFMASYSSMYSAVLRFLEDPINTLKNYKIKSKNTFYEKVWRDAEKDGVDMNKFVRQLTDIDKAFNAKFKKWAKEEGKKASYERDKRQNMGKALSNATKKLKGKLSYKQFLELWKEFGGNNPLHPEFGKYAKEFNDTAEKYHGEYLKKYRDEVDDMWKKAGPSIVKQAKTGTPNRSAY